MSRGNDQAYPTPTRYAENGDIIAFGESGLTVRDAFALAAMQGMVSSIRNDEDYRRAREIAGSENMTVSQWIAREAYKQAEAMVAESTK